MIYAVWASAGIVGMLFVGALVYGERVSLASIIGVALVVSGVTVILLAASEGGESAVEA